MQSDGVSRGQRGEQRAPSNRKIPWWISTRSSPRWSSEETTVRGRIYILAAGIFLPFYGIEMLALNRVYSNHHINAIIGAISIYPLSLYLARRICARCWSELVAKADENAAKRELAELR
jgi:hypothetical protein